MHVEIDRGRWLRGASDGSTLRNPTSCHECCVGTIGRIAGIPAERLETRSFIAGMDAALVPRSLREFLPSEPGLTYADDPRKENDAKKRRGARKKQKLVSDLLYSVNDDAALDDDTRERMLTALAAGIGIRLTFTGKALPRHATPPSDDARAAQAAISHGLDRDQDPVAIELATRVLGDKREWEPLEKTTVVLDTDEKAAEACVYNLLRSHAGEQKHPVRVTATEARSGRRICDRYHEPA